MEYTFQIFLKFFQKLYSKMPFWIPISKGRIDFMKQKERFDEKPKQDCGIACCRVWESTEKEILKNVRSSLILVSQLGKIQTG